MLNPGRRDLVEVMTFLAPRLTLAATASCVLLAGSMPSATAAPSSDGQGYVDSTARCDAPDTAAAFGSTATSRIAICKTSGGQYQYRGVRVSDGAKLILPATQSGGGFVATNDGITYTVTSNALTVSAGNTVIRQEPMVDYHGPQSPATTSPTTTSPTATSPTAASTPTTTSTPATIGPPTTPTPSAPTSTGPPLPPFPAEVGGSGH
jgi:hypothetical protein